MGEYEWDPAGPGEYKIEVMPRDQENVPGPAARAGVTVAGSMVAAASPPVIQTAVELQPTVGLTLIAPQAPTETVTPAAGSYQIMYSEEKVYWRGLSCGEKELEIEVHIQDPSASSVVLFA